jgi:myosin heavy subunit
MAETVMVSIAGAVQDYLVHANEVRRLEVIEERRQREVLRFIQEHDMGRLEQEKGGLTERVDSLMSTNQRLTGNVSRLGEDLAGLRGSNKQSTELEKKNQRLNSELQKLKQVQEQNKQLTSDKKSLEKKLSELNNKNESGKRSLDKFEREKNELQQSDKKLKAELSELKSQLYKQKTAAEKASQELEKQKQQFSRQKSAMESKMETLKNKVKSDHQAKPSSTLNSPARPTFSPAVSKKPAAAAATTATSNRASGFSTTPFLQRSTSILPALNSPSPLKNSLAASAASPNTTKSTIGGTSAVSKRKPSLTFTAKNSNKQISLFDDDDNDLDKKLDGDTTIKPSDTKAQEKRKRRRLKAKSFRTDGIDDNDEDNPDLPGSLFKRVKKPNTNSSSQPVTGIFGLNKEISPLKKRNESIRSQFKLGQN